MGLLLIFTFLIDLHLFGLTHEPYSLNTAFQMVYLSYPGWSPRFPTVLCRSVITPRPLPHSPTPGPAPPCLWWGCSERAALSGTASLNQAVRCGAVPF